jgi:hypothetical protein
MNWTSTEVPLWQIDCENYRKTRQPFELRDVSPEHSAFIEHFTERYDLECKRNGNRVIFFWADAPPAGLDIPLTETGKGDK